MCYKVLFLSLCEDFWEAIKDLCEQFGVGLYVSANKCLEVNNVCSGFVVCWVFKVDAFYFVESD